MSKKAKATALTLADNSPTAVARRNRDASILGQWVSTFRADDAAVRESETSRLEKGRKSGTGRSFQFICSDDGLSAMIQADGVTLRIENDAFAISKVD